MAIIIEDGSIVAGANSYASESQLSDYADVRGISLLISQDELLIRAMDFIEQLDYVGSRLTKDQPLQWPRDNVFIDGFPYSKSEIPPQLIKAQLAVAISINAGVDPLSTIERATKKEKLDVLEVEYQDNASATPVIRAVNAAIRKIVKGGGALELRRW